RSPAKGARPSVSWSVSRGHCRALHTLSQPCQSLSETDTYNIGRAVKWEPPLGEKAACCWPDLPKVIWRQIWLIKMHLDVAAERRFKKQEQNLKCEIGDIKERFLDLLQSCGVEYGPRLSQALAGINLPLPNGLGMSTPRSTQPPRRVSGRLRTPDNMRCMYADLLIEQLLAQASSLTDSSDLSNSPPEQDSSKASSGETAEPSGAVCGMCQCQRDASGYQPPTSVSMVLRRLMSSAHPPTAFVASGSSDVYPASSEHSSDPQVVPDLESELVSRMQYYSGLHHRQQKKIDEATGAVTSPVRGCPQRCVEGSETQPHVIFQLPQPKVFYTPVSRTARSKRDPTSTTDSESDFSSGTGSMSRSCNSSCDRLRHCSSRDVSSSRERTSSSRASGVLPPTPWHRPPSSPTLPATPAVAAWDQAVSTLGPSRTALTVRILSRSYLRSKGLAPAPPPSETSLPPVLYCLAFQPLSQIRGQPSHHVAVGADSPPQEQTLNSSLHLTAMMSC
ncbi:hypothetical protein BaRGS_00008096, partial [Batillaria attramentaria]